MNAKAVKLLFYRCWMRRLLHLDAKLENTHARRNLKRRRHHGPTSFLDMP